MRDLYFIGLFILSTLSLGAQVSFTNQAKTILGGEDIRSTVAIGVDDINGDRKDDLVLLDQGQYLKTFIQKGNDMPFESQEHIQISNFGAWSMITGDLNNDKITEIITSNNENGSTVLFQENGIFSPVQFTAPVYSQNTNLIDLNNDGFLDLFVCNDTGESITYLNDGDGKMTSEKIIDFQTSPEDDMSGNYSSVFTDIDNDRDIDLYIAKCRAGVNDPTDRRRINTLYINNGDGTYTESAESFGLANGAQSWSTDAGDVDNDGDIDLIIANHSGPHDLMINNGDGTFVRFNNLPEASTSFAYQSFFKDFDNNGWLDIFITEPSKSYILYNEEMTFSMYPFSSKAFSGATGDFNSDGFPDLYLGFAPSFQNPSSSKTDAILINNGNQFNWLDITLEGSESNADGIGSRITLYLGDKTKIREVKAGQSYGIMNSTVAHFGLGIIESIDSIKVQWPSGNESHITTPIEGNNHITISENGCLTERITLPNLQLCNDGPISIELDEEYDSYLWSDGSIESRLNTLSPGNFSVVVTKNGCTIESNIFTVTEDFDYRPEEIITAENLSGCRDEILLLTAPPAVSYLWSDGSTERTVELNSTSQYQVTVTTNCDSYISEEYNIPWGNELEPEIIEDSVNIGEIATLGISGADISWYKYENDITPLSIGNGYLTPPLLRDTSFFAKSRRMGNFYSGELMESIPLNSNESNLYPQNDTLPFSVYYDTYIESVSVRTQTAGTRQIEIWNDGEIIFMLNRFFESGLNTISIDLTLNKGEYKMTTNSTINMENLGVEVPLFSYSELYQQSDKNILGHFYIRESEIYDGATPYFFNWKAKSRFFDCQFAYEVNAYVKDPVSINDIEVQSSVYPNPASNYIILESEIDYPANMEMRDMTGKLIMSKLLLSNSSRIELELSTGLYNLTLRSSDKISNSLISVVRD